MECISQSSVCSQRLCVYKRGVCVCVTVRHKLNKHSLSQIYEPSHLPPAAERGKPATKKRAKPMHRHSYLVKTKL